MSQKYFRCDGEGGCRDGSDEMPRFGGDGCADNVTTVTSDPVIAPEEFEKESSSASLLSSLLSSLYEKRRKQQNAAK